MFKRKFYDTLVEWKAQRATNKECLLVKGARQIGKTFIIREFGKQNYENVIELNFHATPKYKIIFDDNLDGETNYMKISEKFRNAKFDKSTLLFLDEIQECGQARTALKFLAEDGRCDVIASGSMLGIAYKEMKSVPVGYERQIEMFAMDFEEFLWAYGFNDEKIKRYKDFFENRIKVDNYFNNAMFNYLREYMVVGGMPTAVKIWLETKNFGLLQDEHEKIINSYLDDIAKYAPTAEKPKARNCYLSLPKQLAKENKKFQYSVVEKNGTARKFDGSIEWLRDAGLVKLCNNVDTPLFPLAAYTNFDYFKVYASDIGILNAMFGFEMKSEIFNNTLKGSVKGGIYENLIADILLKKRLPLLFYKPSENRQEIEFLYTKGSSIIPIEVKAGNNATISLDEFINEYNPPFAYKFITGNVGQADKKITMPLYMAMFL